MQGCREVELTAMQPADAVEFFHKQKIKGTHTEIETACEAVTQVLTQHLAHTQNETSVLLRRVGGARRR